ncbi:hypothetical protein CONPUDRAFT_63110, partial [Coniophora puteana RWD-64-598 SS2]
QHSITAAQVQEAKNQLNMFADKFKKIYVEELPKCLHFVCPWLHAITHLARKVVCKGLSRCMSQWATKQTIGLLRCKICSHTRPYANFASAKCKDNLRRTYSYTGGVGTRCANMHI